MLQTSICHRGLAADLEDSRTQYEFDELDQLVLGKGAPDPETARQQDEIRSLYQRYRTAAMQLRMVVTTQTMNRNLPPGRAPLPTPDMAATPEDVVSFLCDDVVEHYGKLRELALHASKEDLLAGSLFVAMEVLALRHRMDGAGLAAMRPQELLERYYEEGWEPKTTSLDLELGKFGPVGEEVYVDGVRGTSNQQSDFRVLERAFRFEAIPGGWCYDAVWNPSWAEAGESLRYTAPALKKSLDDFVLELVTPLLQGPGYRPQPGLPPVEAGPALWQPLGSIL